MTHDELSELNSLRQYKQETAVYVQRLEDSHVEHMRIIGHQRQEIEQLTFALNRCQDAAIAKVKAVYEYKVEHGIIDRFDVTNSFD